MDDKSMEELERSIRESDEDRALDAYADKLVEKSENLDDDLEAMADKKLHESDSGDFDAELNDMVEKKMNQKDEVPAPSSEINAEFIKNTYQAFWKNALDFKGRTGRSPFWTVVVVNAIIGGVLGLLSRIPFLGLIFGILAGLFSLACVIPGLSIYFRRLHDVGKKGLFILFGLIPVVGWIILLYWAVLPSIPADEAKKAGELS